LWAELVWAVRFEQVQHLDDLLLRRTRLGNVLPAGARDILPQIKVLCSPYLSWSETKWQQEIKRYLALWQCSYSLPQANGASI
jgi:glycerol-3-phosphate dehydrogenase